VGEEWNQDFAKVTFRFKITLTYLMLQNRDDDPLDPMDPAAYSDVPRGTWTTGMQPQLAKKIFNGHFAKSTGCLMSPGLEKLRAGNRTSG
jgi:hypothetical protein